MSARPAVFLDRDGTLIREVDFLRRPEEVELIPGTAEALRQLELAGFARVIVTNQSGVARGYLTIETLAEIHARLFELLAAEGASIDLTLFCPHHPTEGAPPFRRQCNCRKPEPGMLLEATERLDLDPNRSWTVGDSGRDLSAGLAVGARAILVETGKGQQEHARLSERGELPAHYVPDMAAAAQLILRAQ